MVAGHLTKRNGYYYAVLSYYDPDGKRHFKTFSTGLKVVSGNYRKAEEMLQRFRTHLKLNRKQCAVILRPFTMTTEPV